MGVRGWVYVALVPLVAGAAARIWHWAHDRPLWLDEQMIAINVRDGGGFRGLAGPLLHHQSAPLGWLWVERAFLLAFGSGERVLRLQPLLFSLATLVLVWLVVRTWFGPLGALTAALLFGLSPALIRYAAELKQYSADAFCALALLALAAWAAARPRWTHAWWVAAAVASWLSMDAILVTPGLAAVLVGAAWRRGGWRAALRAASLAPVWLAAAGVHYLVALRYTTGEPHLRPWWQQRGGFPDGSLWSWLAHRPAGLAADPLRLPEGPVTVGFWLLVAAGLTVLLARRTPLGLLLAAPLATGVALGAAHAVPLASRLAIWLLPSLYLAAAAGVEAIAALTPRARIPAAAGLTVVAVGAGFVLVPQIEYALAPPRLVDGVDDRAAMAWLAAEHRPGDLVLVSVSSIPAVRWYSSMGTLRPGRFVRPVPPGPDCSPQALPAALAGQRRVLAYSGIRTDPATPAVMEARLAEQGRIVQRRDFRAGVGWLVDLHPPAPPAPVLPGLKTSCLQLSAFGRR
ncbi:glycosyltransferase family 39 protein [Phytohabitans sp. ZYX-F-186]|uniref:Glycosyltransferase family 39 protein n=1 Tax=Phytohabitans maris TaxID=3071409 RepID=A0ABU0ZD55_9ACTN|nr:glycosyltransferase family 39 protein [Phytohabitans sp. ZYX-F-186]MDQ7904978.1 glycosyltransferase family 39 protein [Phytohabitans sp. ZYX-F-186]